MTQRHIDEFTKEELIKLLIITKQQLSILLNSFYEAQEGLTTNNKIPVILKNHLLFSISLNIGQVAARLEILTCFYDNLADKKTNEEMIVIIKESKKCAHEVIDSIEKENNSFKKSIKPRTKN